MNVGPFERLLAVVLLQICLTVETAESTEQVEVVDVRVKFVDYQGPATLSVDASERHRLQIDVSPRSERQTLDLSVELPISGRNAWPAADVEVLDSKGRAMSVRHSGVEWHKLLVGVPAELGTYVVHVVDPPGDRPRPLPEKGRHVTDSMTGLSATISKWFQGRRAALSIRFDDSHLTHLTKAIPILREYGFRGTFMVNPGDRLPNNRRRSAFQEHRSEWEVVARANEHEFANHTLHHRGAQNDTEMEHQVGDASKAIWVLSPSKSTLLALNLGGGTKWVTTKTLRYYLDKYHLFDASANSTGMDDTYGNRVGTVRRLLEKHVERGLWYKVHYHAIGEGHGSSEANCRAVLDVAKEHESELWIAGMADIHKYQTERDRAGLAIANKGSLGAALTLKCSTDPDLYDQYLTIQVALPSGWSSEEVTVRRVESGGVVSTDTASSGAILRFDTPPINAAYILERSR